MPRTKAFPGHAGVLTSWSDTEGPLPAAYFLHVRGGCNIRCLGWGQLRSYKRMRNHRDARAFISRHQAAKVMGCPRAPRPREGRRNLLTDREPDFIPYTYFCFLHGLPTSNTLETHCKREIGFNRVDLQCLPDDEESLNDQLN